ncbi:hypothetical protein B0H66DRAFT_568857 [Apodospora peruviana]|uniref:Uncharacterized protein n=1 Tax=Apodospora peruviana TaxID=516989 RepID=A0AAE0HTR6_9PEZI|nr:hypothetical protein B0H66DRAFT_568857 [Apodospora peruviana]
MTSVLNKRRYLSTCLATLAAMLHQASLSSCYNRTITNKSPNIQAAQAHRPKAIHAGAVVLSLHEFTTRQRI